MTGRDRDDMRRFPNADESVAARRAELLAAWKIDERSRVDFVLDACRGKRVLHLGCVDHSDEAMDSDRWLHRKILNVASACVGVDYERSSIERMRAAGLEAFAADVTLPPSDELLREPSFELVVAGEIIEHVGAPQALLAFARDMLAPGGQILVTTPNPYAPWRTRAGQVNVIWESVDHATYLFPSGIAEMGQRVGLRLKTYTTVDRWDPKLSTSLRSPAVALTLLLLGRARPHREFGWRRFTAPAGNGRLGWRYLTPVEYGMYKMRRRLGQLGETSIYVLERAP